VCRQARAEGKRTEERADSINKVARAQSAPIRSRLVMEEEQHAQEVDVYSGLGHLFLAVLSPSF
jgi:hypothetical protein